MFSWVAMHLQILKYISDLENYLTLEFTMPSEHFLEKGGTQRRKKATGKMFPHNISKALQ